MIKIKKIFCIVLASVCVFGMAGCKEKSDEKPSQQVNESEVTDEETAPDFTIDLIDGGKFTLSEQEGKVVFINFWATWCSPCVKEMPAIEKLHQEYGDEVSIVGIDVGDNKETVASFMKEQGYTYPVACDLTGNVVDKYPTDGIPYSVIVGKDGKIAETMVGAKDANSQYQRLKTAIDAAIQK